MKSHTPTLITFVMCLFLAGQLQGQSLDGSHFKPYSNKWKMYSVDQAGNETLLRIWTDYVQIIDIEGTTYVSRIQELYGPEMHLQELWTNLYEKVTLLPYRASQFKTNGDYQYFEFDQNSVALKTQIGYKAPEDNTFETGSQVYDWTLYGILLSGVDFKKGHSTTLPIFMPQGTNGKASLQVTVEGEEVVTDDTGKQHNTWKVNTSFGLTFWLTKEAPYVIQLILPGQGGSYNIWRMF